MSRHGCTSRDRHTAVTWPHVASRGVTRPTRGVTRPHVASRGGRWCSGVETRPRRLPSWAGRGSASPPCVPAPAVSPLLGLERLVSGLLRPVTRISVSPSVPARLMAAPGCLGGARSEDGAGAVRTLHATSFNEHVSDVVVRRRRPELCVVVSDEGPRRVRRRVFVSERHVVLSPPAGPRAAKMAADEKQRRMIVCAARSDSAARALCIPVDGVSQPFCPARLWRYLETHLEWLGRIWRAPGRLAGVSGEPVIVSSVRASPRATRRASSPAGGADAMNLTAAVKLM